MSYYYKYKFISPEEVYANVKEEFKSYFDSGAIDDLMFPVYVDKCLRKLGVDTYQLEEINLVIDNFQARLPDNFHQVREAWLCVGIESVSFRNPSSVYSQTFTIDGIQLSPVIANGQPCNNPNCNNPGCNGYECLPELIEAVYKVNNEINFSFKKSILLKPGTISAMENCGPGCANYNGSSLDSFDIRDNKFIVNFRKGVVRLIYYAKQFDKNGNPLVPDNFRVLEYIEAFIKFKVIETLLNQIHDETVNQLERKLLRYEQQANEAFIMAEIELKKQTLPAKMMAIRRTMRGNRIYEI